MWHEYSRKKSEDNNASPKFFLFCNCPSNSSSTPFIWWVQNHPIYTLQLQKCKATPHRFSYKQNLNRCNGGILIHILFLPLVLHPYFIALCPLALTHPWPRLAVFLFYCLWPIGVQAMQNRPLGTTQAPMLLRSVSFKLSETYGVLSTNVSRKALSLFGSIAVLVIIFALFIYLLTY